VLRWRITYSEIIADNLGKAGWSWGCVSAVDSRGRTIFAVDAHRDGQRFIVRADEKLMAFMELESAIRISKSTRGRGERKWARAFLKNIDTLRRSRLK
jgi:hypothetical protein